MTGVVWVLRDSGGGIVLYSRRVFENVGFFLDAKFYFLMWAIEFM